jgi:hypothetical protein
MLSGTRTTTRASDNSGCARGGATESTAGEDNHSLDDWSLDHRASCTSSATV